MRNDIEANDIEAKVIAVEDSVMIQKTPGTDLSLNLHGFHIRPLKVTHDALALHRWFIQERAAFWNMQDKRVNEVAAFYQTLEDSGHAHAWIGMRHGARSFLFECYDPAYDEVGEHYRVLPGDVGMHLFIGPAEKPESGYTRRVFQTVMTFMFDYLHASRIVVEPDRRNARIHALNRAMGFTYAGDVAFRAKTASLAFCTRAAFSATLQKTTHQDLTS